MFPHEGSRRRRRRPPTWKLEEENETLEQGVAFVVGEVCGDAGGEVLEEGGCVAGAGEVEEFAGEFEGLWGELRAG